jgi:ABC-type antimicrobial peptide transport system permease subunit
MIGIMSIVTMLTTGLGAKKTMLEDVEKNASSKEIIVTSVNTQRKDRLITDAVVKKIEKIDNVAGVYPVIEADGDEKISGFVGWNAISGVPKEYMEYLTLKEGSFPEKNGSRPELLIGGGIRNSLYSEKTWQQFKKTTRGKESLVGKRMDFAVQDMHESSADSDENEDSAEESEAYSSDTAPEEKQNDETKKDTKEDGEDKEKNTDESSSEESKQEKKYQKLRIVGEVDNEYDYNIYTDIDTMKLYLKRQSVNGKIPGQPLDKENRPYNTWSYSRLIIRVDSVDNVERVSKVIQDMGYEVQNNLEMLDNVTRTVNMIQFVLGALGTIAAIVAIIGIINTMTTAVYDRVKEIGLLKMLGSDSDDISFMFLFESALMGFIGGILGVGLSLLVDIFINKKLVEFMKMPEDTWMMVTPAWLLVSAIAVSVIVSVLAGAFPARWASKIKPLEAIAS